MLDDKKVGLMTRIATYEQKAKKQDIAVNRFSRKDYISLKLITAFFEILVMFLILLIMWAVYDSDRLVDLINKYGVRNIIILFVVMYVLITWFYLEFKYFSYSRRYYTAEIRIKKYQGLLKSLNDIYEKEALAKKREVTLKKVSGIDIDKINIENIGIEESAGGEDIE